jgi:hypothetical protein
MLQRCSAHCFWGGGECGLHRVSVAFRSVLFPYHFQLLVDLVLGGPCVCGRSSASARYSGQKDRVVCESKQRLLFHLSLRIIDGLVGYLLDRGLFW